MWWGGRGQSFNIAPQEEEPEMGVRRWNGGGEGSRGVARGCEWGCSGSQEGRKDPEEGVSVLSTVMELALPFSVSSCLIIH